MKKTVFLTLCLSIGLVSVFAQVQKKSTTLGFIFNTDNLFLDLESYQAGMGIKLWDGNKNALRILFDGFYSNSTEAFSTTLGVTYENHFKPGRVSPYWGGFIQTGYLNQTTETDSDNWIKSSSFPVSGGLVLGAEFFILEYLSVFAEYGAKLNGTILTTTTSVAGVENETGPKFNYSLDTGMGNDSKLGITIYLNNVIKIDKK